MIYILLLDLLPMLTSVAQLYLKFTLTRHTKAVNALTVRDEHGYQPPAWVLGVGATRVRVWVGGGLGLVPVGHLHQ